MGVGWVLTCGLLICACGLLLNYVVDKQRQARRVTEEQRVEAARHKKWMEELIATEGWKLLEAAAKVQTSQRENMLKGKPTSDLAEENFMKGEVQGIEIFMKIPEVLVQNSKAVLDAYNEQGE